MLILVFSGLGFPLFAFGKNDAPGFERRDLVITRGDGSPVTIKTEIAASPAQKERGFMFRKTVNDGEGMLFVFDRDEVVSFWMKNTYVPLSIAFIASDGRILEIKDMEPESTKHVVSSRSVRYALEVKQGWFGRAGIVPGDRLSVRELRE